jgi:hypothetical protein
MTPLNKTLQLTTRLFPLILLLSAVTAWGQSGQLSIDSFGFQCGIFVSTNCPNYQWPQTQEQPGVFRLWDANVDWSVLNPSQGRYNFDNTLGVWLDKDIADEQPRAVIYTFGRTPCWAANGQGCSGHSAWSYDPPSDLGNGCSPNNTTGSQFFCDFVSKLVNYCSPGGHCVSQYINYFELWNEANSQAFWTGKVVPLYQMMAPAVSIIKQKIPTAKILTPPISNAGGKAAYQGWACSWLAEELASPISDIYAFHTYLQDNIPENQCCSPNSLAALQLAPNEHFSTTCPNNQKAWSPLPWWVTETDYNAGDENPNTYDFICNQGSPYFYSDADCAGQILRWQAIINSNGGTNLTWYYWNTAIGNVSQNEIAYYWTMQYFNHGQFTAPCSVSSGTAWTCPFGEASGQSALFVWTTNPASGQTYTLPNPNPYVDYRDLQGNTTHITPGETTVPISVEPIMLETLLTT